MANPILIARHGDTECHLLPALANRHGLITGATGTGKTITLQGLGRGAVEPGRAGLPGRHQG
jgi:Cdc6-like AAA superfamily ATPase